MGMDQDSIRAEVSRLRAYTERLAREEMRSRSFIQILQAQVGPRAEAVPGAGEPAYDPHAMAGVAERRMNIFDRLSRWWEGRKVVRHSEFVGSLAKINQIIEMDRKTAAAAKIAELLVRMDRLELFVGMKREQQPVAVPGAARIS